MISWNSSDAALATHAAEHLQDAMLDRPHEYGNCDDVSVKKLAQLGERSGLMVTGEALAPGQAEALLKQVVLAELNSWVPDSSQRLIDRAARALGFEPLLDPILTEDHGPRPEQHALVQDWVCGIYTMRCATCAHLFRV